MIFTTRLAVSSLVPPNGLPQSVNTRGRVPPCSPKLTTGRSPLLMSACAILREMASFDSAGVSRQDSAETAVR